MKILAFVDLHASERGMKSLKKLVKKENPDIIVCAGDMTIFEQHIEVILKKISQLKKPVLVIHGNHEDEHVLDRICLEHENMFFIHKKAFVYEEVLFLGWGGGGFSTTDKEFERKAKGFKKKMEGFDKVVLITHAPPYNTKIDKIIDESCGNKSIRRFIIENTKKVKVAISGHLHENAGREDRIKETRIVNPGPFGKVITV
jgi:Icc-related predicted phosphoesterase